MAAFDDTWIEAMIQEGERRATERMAPKVDEALALIPEMYRPLVRSLVRGGITHGQNAAFQVLHEQGWFRADLSEPA